MQIPGRNSNNAVAIWLFSGCLMLAVILIVGGLTRLNQAGLSITEWEVIGGVIPPLNEAQWVDAFDQYRQFPEYQELNRGMSLAAFKHIYWWEYTHRMLARVLGILFIIPFAYFLWKRKIDRKMAWKVSGIFALGGVQGMLGWYMVQSGLMGEPYVSHLRLTLHLGLAVIIFALLFRLALTTWYESSTESSHPAMPPFLYNLAWVLIALIFIQILYGGLVAGLKGGFVYNTFPKMGDYWLPPEIGYLAPWWKDVVNNAITVQFIHRLLAYTLTVLTVWLWFSLRQIKTGAHVALVSHYLLGLISLQVIIGVSVLLTYSPVWLSAVHQGVALLVFTVALWLEKLLQNAPKVFETPVLHRINNSQNPA